MTELKVVLRRNVLRALRARDLDAARDALAALRNEDPTSLETRALELEVLIREGDLGSAEPLAAQILELHPDSARVRFLGGELAYRRRAYPEAIEHLRESHRIHPHPRSQHLLARALTQHGDLEEAERLLLELVPRRPTAKRDLAWLYERRGEDRRALETAEDYLEERPDDPLARSQVERLRARRLSGGELVSEVEGLLELGEDVPEGVIAEYCEQLVRRGDQERLRSFLAERSETLPVRVSLQVGWVCYRLQLYDLAFQHLLRGLPERPGDVKLLAALEKAARVCRRVDRLIEAYEELAPGDPRFFGRAKALRS